MGLYASSRRGPKRSSAYEGEEKRNYLEVQYLQAQETFQYSDMLKYGAFEIYRACSFNSKAPSLFNFNVDSTLNIELPLGLDS